MAAFIDLTGQRFGRLVALEYVGFTNRKARFLFQCDCGNKKVIVSQRVRDGRTKSCGCQGPPSGSDTVRYRHGMAGSPEYVVWMAAKARCRVPTSQKYKDYGGRSITFCERWDDFANFIADMGRRPAGMTIERIDNDGPYSPNNCRWATHAEQCLNQRSNVVLTYKGETKPLSVWARELNIPRSTLRHRAKLGVALEGSFKCRS